MNGRTILRPAMVLLTMLLASCMFLGEDSAVPTAQPSFPEQQGATFPPSVAVASGESEAVTSQADASTPESVASTPEVARVATVAPVATGAPEVTEAPAEELAAAACDSANATWIGTFGFGLSCLDEGGWHSYTADDSPLPNNQIKDAAVCADGRAWIAHSLGLSVTDGAAWQSYRDEWGGGSPEAVACDRTGGIWLAFYGGAAHLSADGWTRYEASELGTGEFVASVKDVALGPDGAVWLVTTNSVATGTDTGWTVYEQGSGLDDTYYFAGIAVSQDGLPWVTHASGVLHFSGESWTAYDQRELMQSDPVLVDGAGRVWVGTYSHGVQVFENGGWRGWSRENSAISSNHVLALALDGAGRVWAGTEYGLSVLVEDTWQPYHMHSSEMLDDELYALAVGGVGPTLPAPTDEAPGSLTGVFLRGDEPVAGATIELCSEIIGMVFAGPSPCFDQPFTLSATTGTDGRFTIVDVPEGRYGLAFRLPDQEGWMRLTGSFGVGDQEILVSAGAETDIGEIDVREDE